MVHPFPVVAPPPPAPATLPLIHHWQRVYDSVWCNFPFVTSTGPHFSQAQGFGIFPATGDWALLLTTTMKFYTSYMGISMLTSNIHQARQNPIRLTMAQLAALIIAITHVCSFLLLLPWGQLLGTNAPLSPQKPCFGSAPRFPVSVLLGWH